jgi:hypothetical protein
MKAGRELDALVAEKIFGLKFDCERCRNESLDSYSTDIAAAFEVVDAIGKRIAMESGVPKLQFLTLSQLGYWSAGYAASFGFPWFQDDQWEQHANDFSASAQAETAPLAICLAALKAVGVNTMTPSQDP